MNPDLTTDLNLNPERTSAAISGPTPEVPEVTSRASAGRRGGTSAKAPAKRTGIAGRVYLEDGQPVTVLVAWASVSKARPVMPAPSWLIWHRPPPNSKIRRKVLIPPQHSPRNVLIQRADGTRVVRPFRGLRKPPLSQELP